MRDPFSSKAWSTGIKHTEKTLAGIIQVGSRLHVSGPECFSRAIRAAVIPPNFRLATGVSKFTGESKPDTWLEDY